MRSLMREFNTKKEMFCKHFFIFAVCAAFAVLWAGCSGEAEKRKSPASVLFITVDTLRSDGLAGYGDRDQYTPNIDALMKNGSSFFNANVHVPITNPSHASMMTGLYPAQHGAVTFARKIKKEVVTLAEIFKKQNYQTAAFVSGFSLVRWVSGLEKGFEVYDDEWGRDMNATERPADETTDAALQWLEDRKSAPFFLWVHYFDPHKPYEPPPLMGRIHWPEYDPKMGDEPGSMRLKSENETKKMELLKQPETDSPPSPLRLQKAVETNANNTVNPRSEAPDDLQEKIALYKGEIVFTDHHIGRLIRFLHRNGIEDRVLVVLTSDHGESFEHGYYFRHMDRVYETLMNVPLIFYGPGIQRDRCLFNPVEAVDIAPTVLELTETFPLPEFKGISLKKLLTGSREDSPLPEKQVIGQTPGREGELSWGPMDYVKYDNWKLIRKLNQKSLELYDLQSDPAEMNNLAKTKNEKTRELLNILDIRTDDLRKNEKQEEESVLSDHDEEKFRALGYIQ